MAQIDFDEFERYLFDRETTDDIEWFFHESFHEMVLPSETILNFSNRIFLNINELSLKYSEEQLCLGLEYLINSSASLACYSFLDEKIDITKRSSAVQNMHHVFESVFEKKCTDSCSHKSNKNLSRYNNLCYMWWDIFPRHGVPRGAESCLFDEAVIKTLDKILKLTSVACIESALHGLGHWYAGYPAETKKVIEASISRMPDELIAYAKNAMTGDVQ